MTYSIIEAIPTHILPIAAAIDAEVGPSARAVGMTTRGALRHLFHQSAYRRTALMDGKPVALWGATGSFLDDEAEVWLALAPRAKARPFVVVREVVKELAEMLSTRRALRSSILCQDARAVRFAQFFGFKVDETTQVVGATFFRATLRRA